MDGDLNDIGPSGENSLRINPLHSVSNIQKSKNSALCIVNEGISSQ